MCLLFVEMRPIISPPDVARGLLFSHPIDIHGFLTKTFRVSLDFQLFHCPPFALLSRKRVSQKEICPVCSKRVDRS